MRRTALLKACLLGAALCACRDTGRVAELVTVRDSAGIEIVENNAPAWGRRVPWIVSRDPVVEIGSVDGPSEQEFYQARGAVLMSDGRIAVLNSGTQEIRVYGSDGEHVRSMGGRGDGPGEFQLPVQLMLLNSDTLLVWDDRANRMSWFDSSGSFVRSVSKSPKAIPGLMSPPYFYGWVELLRDGSFLVRFVESIRSEDLPEGFHRAGWAFLQVDEHLSHVDTLAWLTGLEQASPSVEGQNLAVIAPYPRNTVRALGGTPTRIVLGEQEASEVHVYERGHLRQIIRWEAALEPITAEDIERWKRIASEWLAPRAQPEAVKRVLDDAPIRRFRSPYGEIQMDAAGNLWVLESTITPLGIGLSDWSRCMVFDVTGRLLGTTDIPPGRIMEIGDDYLLTVQQDDDYVDFVRMYRIEKGGQG